MISTPLRKESWFLFLAPFLRNVAGFHGFEASSISLLSLLSAFIMNRLGDLSCQTIDYTLWVFCLCGFDFNFSLVALMF